MCCLGLCAVQSFCGGWRCGSRFRRRSDLLRMIGLANWEVGRRGSRAVRGGGRRGRVGVAGLDLSERC